MATIIDTDTPQEPRATQLRAEGAVYRGRLLRQPEGYDAEVWEHEAAEVFSCGRTLSSARWLSDTWVLDDQGRSSFAAWVSHPDNIADLRSRGLLPPLDSEGTPRADWVGLGRWVDEDGDAVDFDRGQFIYRIGGTHALAKGWTEHMALVEGYTPEAESAPKPEPTGETADKLRAVGARYAGVYKGARFWEHENPAAQWRCLSSGVYWGPNETRPHVSDELRGTDCLIYPETAAAMRAAGLLSLGNGGEGAGDRKASGECGSASTSGATSSATRSPSPPEPSTEHCYALDGPRRLPESPDTRSTALVSVEGGRLRLHIDPDGEHTGLLEDRAKRLEQWHAVLCDEGSIRGAYWICKGRGDSLDLLEEAFGHAETLDAEGWPTSRHTPAVQAIREAHRALEVALCEASREGAGRG